ncbi:MULTISPECIES: ribonucleotide-diphosphate reductase subunit beta [unclassified Streptomyces]|uniref:ribonucleotide-diphosphate reductase subunit beta n=1 Tax=unclassified Streptomyces TaxID=2593676 RepID=UPI00223822ED|nr:ribonucleotide-diphosphate reductase subunit beta [Streptomyces sp. SHP 1-2]MCW5252467.1 ribonucleotide-diphosphate reductase subunit beta [Streptomyces sp. SHP 1-2]
MTRWSTLLLDEAGLREMAGLPVAEIAGHAQLTIASRPTYRTLYRSWDKQHWSAEALELERDAEHWQRVPAETKARLERIVRHFLVGEYTGLDLLAPIALGAPDEASLIFLGTQSADESRHTRLMDRLASEVLGLGGDDLRQALDSAWQHSTPAQLRLNELEARLIRPLSSLHGGHDDWLRAVAVFHIVTEGVLALTAQRRLVSSLRSGSFLPGLRAGFVAMTRDESRHVAFGVEAVRRGVTGTVPGERIDAVADALREALALAVAVELPADATPQERAEALAFGRELEGEALLRLRSAGFRPDVITWIRGGMTATLASLEAPEPDEEDARHAG